MSLVITFQVASPLFGANPPLRENYETQPFTATGVTVPEVLLAVSKDLKMFYQGYAGLIVDIDGDGRLDTGFNPAATYIGYFDPDSCYVHTGPEGGSNHRATENSRYFYRVAFTVPDDSQATINSNRPAGLKAYIPSYRSKHGICRGVTSGGKKTFSGNWLNFIISSRMDVVRKILYGGSRVVDTDTDTFLEPSFVPHDASIWGSEVMADNAWNRTPFNVYFDITKYTPFAKPNSNTGHYFARTRDRSQYGPWDPRGTASSADGNIFPVLQFYANASNNGCGSGTAGHYWDWIMQSRPVPNAGAGCLTDSNVKSWRATVKVCSKADSSDKAVAQGEQCTLYGDAPKQVYKPTGLLQEYGGNGKMRFGLMTGGFNDSLRAKGGIMRNHVASLTNSINPATGQFLTSGLMWAFDKLQISGRWIYGYEGGNAEILYSDLNSWGNPMGEMLFESIRYLVGKTSPTSSFSNGEDGDRSGAALGGSPYLKSPINKLLTANSLKSWSGRLNPSECSKPVVMLISDIDTSFDGDDISASNDLNSYDLMPGVVNSALPKQFNVASYLKAISLNEGIGGSKKYFYAKADTDDCSPKTISTLDDVKGLCPMGPSYRGTYAVASAAYYAHTHNMSRTSNKMPIDVYSVTMSAAFPELKLDLKDGRRVSVLPLNTTNRCSSGLYNACNKVLSFLNYFLTDMETDKNGLPISFTIQVNFSDFGMGDDWEMDMVVEYKVVLLTNSTTNARFRSSSNLNTLAGNANYVSGVFRNQGANYYFVQNPTDVVTMNDMVDLNSITVSGVAVFSRMHRTASGGSHGLGYTISGTTYDGTYLDLNLGSPPASNFLTPPGCAYSNGPSPCKQSPGTSTQIRTFSFSSSGSNNEVLQNPMWMAAKYGGFSDSNNNGIPDPGEWENPEGEPKNYFQATNIAELPDKLTEAFRTIASSITTGTATSASVNSVLGGGISVQTAYYPEYTNPDDDSQKVRWVGTVYGLFVDKYGNLREDTNGDHKLKLSTIDNDGDNILTFNNPYKVPAILPDCYTASTVSRCTDPYGNNNPVVLDSPPNIHRINSVWDTGQWLAELDPFGDKLLTGSRSYSTAATKSGGKRRIYFGQPDGSAQLPLFNTSDGSLAILEKYMLHDNFREVLPTVAGIQNTKAAYTKKLVEYIQGAEVPGWRTRTIANPWGSSPATIVWRLADIINSKPIIVGPPSFNYDTIYGDYTYGEFRVAQGGRRQMVYVGSNDGIFHAINMGFYGSLAEGLVGYGLGDSAKHELGAEVWAYVPTSVLPQLQWLPNPDYVHSYYVDMKPLLADVKISGEWRTILIGGLRLGGRPISDPDSSDGVIQNFYSELFCLDVTNPEAEPKFLWRYSGETMGLSVGAPSVVTSGGKWYVVIPSGPKTDTFSSNGQVVYGQHSPYDGYSDQNARLIVLDAGTGAELNTGNNLIVSEANSFFTENFIPLPQGNKRTGTWNDNLVYYGLTISRVESTCLDSGAVYRLVMSDSSTSQPLAPNAWKLERFISTDRPVTGAVNSTYDNKGNLWVIFATGRLWGIQDLTPCAAVNTAACRENHLQFLYGVKEETDINGKMTYSDRTLELNKLADLTGASVYRGGMVAGLKAQAGLTLGTGGTTTYTVLADAIKSDKFIGYKRQLDISRVLQPGITDNFEISITQPKITGLGNGVSLMAFTSFEPNTVTSFCGDLGKSYMYLLDTFTGLPSPMLYSAFSNAPENAESALTDPVNLVPGGVLVGDNLATEASFYVTANSVTARTSLGGSITDVSVEKDKGIGNTVISWREALNTGFTLSKDSMVIGLEPGLE
jgi:type IV pilus assembly protein PilY1